MRFREGFGATQGLIPGPFGVRQRNIWGLRARGAGPRAAMDRLRDNRRLRLGPRLTFVRRDGRSGGRAVGQHLAPSPAPWCAHALGVSNRRAETGCASAAQGVDAGASSACGAATDASAQRWRSRVRSRRGGRCLPGVARATALQRASRSDAGQRTRWWPSAESARAATAEARAARATAEPVLRVTAQTFRGPDRPVFTPSRGWAAAWLWMPGSGGPAAMRSAAGGEAGVFGRTGRRPGAQAFGGPLRRRAVNRRGHRRESSVALRAAGGGAAGGLSGVGSGGYAAKVGASQR